MAETLAAIVIYGGILLGAVGGAWGGVRVYGLLYPAKLPTFVHTHEDATTGVVTEIMGTGPAPYWMTWSKNGVITTPCDRVFPVATIGRLIKGDESNG